MIKFFIDIFCKDTIVGLCYFEDKRKRNTYKYKQKYSPLYIKREEHKIKFNNHFIGPIAYPL